MIFQGSKEKDGFIREEGNQNKKGSLSARPLAGDTLIRCDFFAKVYDATRTARAGRITHELHGLMNNDSVLELLLSYTSHPSSENAAFLMFLIHRPAFSTFSLTAAFAACKCLLRVLLPNFPKCARCLSKVGSVVGKTFSVSL